MTSPTEHYGNYSILTIMILSYHRYSLGMQIGTIADHSIIKNKIDLKSTQTADTECTCRTEEYSCLRGILPLLFSLLRAQVMLFTWEFH